MKRLLYKNAGTYGFDTGKLPQEVTKRVARFLKDEVDQLEPGVKLPNKIASAMYKVPDLAENLPYLLPLPLRGVRAVSNLSSVPTKVIQKLIPGDGKYWKQIIPALLQAGGQQ